MNSRRRSSRSRSIDLPKPDTGLAEWTSKIKAMQRQVDADDEAEQKKLEEEIAASRLARMRRSQGSKTSSLDLTLNPEYAGALRSNTPSNKSSDDLKPIDRQADQEEALRKLMGSRGLSSPVRPGQERKPTSPLAQSQPKPEAMSLAAFMGGRATGPRLNRHAPQQDAHDPTQFDQRTRVDAPHPVSGRGGVAMPGMVAKGRSSLQPERDRDISDRSRSVSPMPDYNKPSSGPFDTVPPVPEVSGQSEALSRPTSSYGGRERGTSISSGNSRARSSNSHPKVTSNSADDTGRSSGLLEPFVEKRNVVNRSPSPGTSFHPRPEPPLTPAKHEPQPVSRDYDFPSNHRRPSRSPARPVEQPRYTPPVPPKQGDPVSLAAFMGGRATGPWLNKHAPQQDAHDPTQFDQRTNITAPHPVFGKGGVAMPGMIKGTSSARNMSGGQIRDAEDGSQPIAIRTELQPSTYPNTGKGVSIRERAISTPGGFTSRTGSSSPQGDFMKSDNARRPVTKSSLPDIRAKTPTNTTNTPSPSPPATSRPYTPRQSAASTPPASSTPQKSSPITMPSLARPIQPEPRQSPTGPQIPPTKNPSRAFLRPPAEKEPTPSLSRLKGRGFVQSMIKTSTQLEASASEFGGTDMARAAPRKSSVLDRWQITASASSTSISPPTSPKPIPIRKSRTTDQTTSFSDTGCGSIPPDKALIKPVDTSRSLKSFPSIPTMSPADNPRPSSRASSSKTNDISTDKQLQNIPGLGSSSTLISYIKPTKTGDDPLPPSARNSLDREGRGGRKSLTSELPVASGEPLKHPTKGRARKPRKDRDAKPAQYQGIPGIPTSGMNLPSYVERPASTAAIRTESLATPSFSTPRAVTPPNARHTNGKLEQSRRNLSSEDLPLVNRVTEERANQAIIEVKPLSPNSPIESRSTPKSPNGSLPLPGITTSTPLPASEMLKQDVKPERSPSTPLLPERHTRIPSTGNRATVMDVAQAWIEQPVGAPSATDNAEAAALPHKDIIQGEFPEMIERPAEALPQQRHMTSPNVQAEKRISSYEKYSAVILPSLPEEKTPASSPVVTLSRSAIQDQLKHGSIDKYGLDNKRIPRSLEVAPNIDANLVHFDHADEPLPRIDISALVNANAHKFTASPFEVTISINVMHIAKSTAASISKDTHVFYDTEILAIIHRCKSMSSGLVSTKVWGWQGKRSRYGEKEDRKLQELAKRYGTTLYNVQETVHQYQEPSELVYLLGGTLAIRQGIRAHWSSENTTMHSVRSYNGLIFIEEHDLSIKNMCSGFSYCFTILDTLYVWYGCGSRQQEREAALKYAQDLAAKGSVVVELAEGESDDDEMFWMMLGEDEYGKADYWKWRRTSPELAPRLWRVDADKGEDACQFTSSTPETMALQDAVYLIDCIWEYFVLVGQKARGKRRDIRLAMSVAQQISNRVASSRPFRPTIHSLILPSRLPLDLRLQLRGIDEVRLNNDVIPDHMNILPYLEGLEHLKRRSWDKAILWDHTMLPLGLDLSGIP